VTLSRTPFGTSIRISVAASYQLVSIRTAVFSLVLEPLLQVSLVALVVIAVGARSATMPAYAATLVGASAAVMSGMTAMMASDRALSIVPEVFAFGLFRPVYWIGRAVVPALLASVLALFAFAGIWLIEPRHSIHTLLAALICLPLAVIVGAVVGGASSVISFAVNDPYIIANVVALAMPLLAGVVVPTEDYPPFLQPVSFGIPMSGTVGFFRWLSMSRESVGPVAVHLAREGVVLVAWLLIAYLVRRIAFRRVRKGETFSF